MTGAIVVALALLVGVVEDGVVVSDPGTGVVAALVEPCVPDAGLALGALVAGGVACGVAAGGWTVLAGLARAPTNDGSRGASWPTAKEALGAGPIAAPTATPSASIAAARAAVTRGDGARKEGTSGSQVRCSSSQVAFSGKPQHG